MATDPSYSHDTEAHPAASNATPHILLRASEVLAAGESEADWEALYAATCRALAPVGYLQTLIVERIAHLQWRRQRMIGYEALGRDAKTAAAIRRSQAHLSRMLREAMKELEFVRAHWPAPVAQPSGGSDGSQPAPDHRGETIAGAGTAAPERAAANGTPLAPAIRLRSSIARLYQHGQR